MLQELTLTEDERAATAGDAQAVAGLLLRLAKEPIPAGPAPVGRRWVKTCSTMPVVRDGGNARPWSHRCANPVRVPCRFVQFNITTRVSRQIAERYYLEKGAKVFLEGKLTTRKWQDQSGAGPPFSTEIHLTPWHRRRTDLS